MPGLPDNYLKTILDAQDGVAEVRRVGTGDGQYGHYTHVSSLIGACSRMHALAAMDDRTIRETVTGGHRVMWAIGRHVEKHIRQQYLLSTNRRWRSVAGNASASSLSTSVIIRQALLPSLPAGLDQYHEYTLFRSRQLDQGQP